MSAHTNHLVLWFSEVDKEDEYLVGTKGAYLGEIANTGATVPNGFIISSRAYFNFFRENHLAEKIKHLLSTVNYDRPESIAQVSTHISKLIIEAQLSKDLVDEVTQAYSKLSGMFKQSLVAVKSSPTNENLSYISIIGETETFLNVKGYSNILLKMKECWASFFDFRALSIRQEKNFDHFRIGIAVVIQNMIESEKSGIMFTVDPLHNEKNKIVIESVLGLGDTLNQTNTTPDRYEIDKPSLQIVQKIVELQSQMVKKIGLENKIVKVNANLGNQQKLNDEEIIQLAQIGKKLEQYYYFPQECEWAIEKGRLYILQTRPITVFSKNKLINHADSYAQHGELLLTGRPSAPGIAWGSVKILNSPRDIEKVTSGEILVAKQPDVNFIPALTKVSAVITQEDTKTSQAARLARDMGLPTVVGVQNAAYQLKNGDIVTVNGTRGEVYSGGLINSKSKKGLLEPKYLKTATQVYVSLSEIGKVAQLTDQHIDGIGLLSAESLLEHIGLHPKKVILDGRQDEYIAKLVEQLEMVCSHLGQRPVIYRISDFQTNEYRNLVGGKTFEPHEKNPFLGYRGALRYIHDQQVFEMELEAIKIARNKRGVKNLWIAIPFVRNVRELEEVKKIIAANGLYRSPSFKVHMMCEIPSNVVMLEKFLDVGIDGIIIDSDVLTTLMMGTDRENSEVAYEFDEQNESVMWAYERVIRICKKHNISSSICGQATSLYPDLVEKLVRWGISSISTSFETAESLRSHIATIESHL